MSTQLPSWLHQKQLCAGEKEKDRERDEEIERQRGREGERDGAEREERRRRGESGRERERERSKKAKGREGERGRSNFWKPRGLSKLRSRTNAIPLNKTLITFWLQSRILFGMKRRLPIPYNLTLPT